MTPSPNQEESMNRSLLKSRVSRVIRAPHPIPSLWIPHGARLEYDPDLDMVAVTHLVHAADLLEAIEPPRSSTPRRPRRPYLELT